MMYLRSWIFNILFYGVTAGLAFLVVPTLLLPAAAIRAVARFWGWLTVQLLHIVGASHRVSGDQHLGDQVIYAAKHQSAWETIVLSLLLHTPVVVLKRELLMLPLLGMYFQKAGCVAVDRSAGMRALRKLREDAVAARDSGRSLLIFPQGTRVAPGMEHKYEIGVFALYEATGLPVVPIALNSGQVWGRNSWLKRSGRIEVEFLPPIAPGLSRRDFMAALESAIETRMAVLDAPYLDSQT
jgi:1-acyl-sn-glycerol-3-phosphate acyltransferase|tara:strand:- start:8310 stop:9029 length:720 start_codon:yes stop_codon:yes gene_type:complete